MKPFFDQWVSRYQEKVDDSEIKGLSFAKFSRDFREDVRKLIKHQQTILPITGKEPVGDFYEILLHAFNPAASNPLAFGRPKFEGGAMQRIKQLFAEQLDTRELLRLVS